MVDFAGWEMPLHYGSQIEEHHSVRNEAGMFDVSHMTVIDIAGERAGQFLCRLVANNVGKLVETGKALYGLLLNDAGGVVDDLIVYRREKGYRCVVNAGSREKVLVWFAEHNDEGVELEERDLAMVAVQGPRALSIYEQVSGLTGLAELAPFSARDMQETMVARTGYTGEDGVEIILPGEEARSLWHDLAAAGVAPAGLAARDTLRLEAGLNLYGQDMDDATSPLVSNLGWTIDWEPREFIGRKVLETARESGIDEKLTGLIMEGKGILRHGQLVITEKGNGVVTSGLFSPTLGYSIALARIPRTAKGACEVEIRNKRQPVKIVRPPFVRHGQRVFKTPS